MNAVEEIIKKALKRADVAVCVVGHRQINVDVLGDCMSIFGSKKHRFTWMPNIGEADVSRARSRAATYFYKQRTEDIILFIDDDIRFDPEDVEKVINHVISGKLICGAMYVQKGKLDKTLVLEEGDSITFGPNQEVKKVVCIANGFMAIHRKVFEVLSKQENNPLCFAGHSWEMYPFFDSQPMKMDNGSWIFASEDWSFCLKARQAGIDTWVDPSIYKLGHLGEYQYDLRDRLRTPKMEWEKFEGVTFK